MLFNYFFFKQQTTLVSYCFHVFRKDILYTTEQFKMRHVCLTFYYFSENSVLTSEYNYKK